MSIKEINPESIEYQQETDGEMFKNASIRFAAIFFFLALSDLLLELFIWFFEVILEFFYLCMEAGEYAAELLMEHAFTGDHHFGEVVLINSFIAINLILIFFAGKKIPRAVKRIIRRIKWMFIFKKRNKMNKWKKLPLGMKVKKISIYSLGFSGLFFMITL